MRWFYIAVIVAITAVVLLFKVQNFDSATITLLSMSFTMPVSVLVIGVYVLGMFTGGAVMRLLRTAAEGARRPR
jgi:uncharacterized integral membrane protein